MSCIESSRRKTVPMSVAWIVVPLGLSAFAALFSRLHYIVYLVQEGYTVTDITVPWSVWWTYQTTVPGLVWNATAIAPWVFLVLMLAITKGKAMKKPMVMMMCGVLLASAAVAADGAGSASVKA